MANATRAGGRIHYRRAVSRSGELGCGERQDLTTICATHGHGDHFFGASTVLERFADARFVARADVVAIMRQQASPESLAAFWNPRFPGQISRHLVIAEELTGTSLTSKATIWSSCPSDSPILTTRLACTFPRSV